MADDTTKKKSWGQRIMDNLTKDYKYTVRTPEGREEDDQTPAYRPSQPANPRKDAEIDQAADETGESLRGRGKKKGGVVRARGVGCAIKGHGKGTMR
jgi:hypothetical protein